MPFALKCVAPPPRSLRWYCTSPVVALVILISSSRGPAGFHAVHRSVPSGVKARVLPSPPTHRKPGPFGTSCSHPAIHHPAPKWLAERFTTAIESVFGMEESCVAPYTAVTCSV